MSVSLAGGIDLAGRVKISAPKLRCSTQIVFRLSIGEEVRTAEHKAIHTQQHGGRLRALRLRKRQAGGYWRRLRGYQLMCGSYRDGSRGALNVRNIRHIRNGRQVW